MLDLKKLLLTSAQKQIVGITLTPGIGLEAVIYDKNKNIALKYGRKKIEYNFSTREIQDYIEFKTALSSLIKELGIANKATAFLVLPNVYFGFAEVSPTLTETEIGTLLLSNAEEFYVFKKEEPVAGWCNIPNMNDPSMKRLVYTSFQKNAIENLKNIFSEVGLKLVGIESTYSATIRGLFTLGYLDDVISKKESWTAMIVNTNSFTMLYFDAENLNEYSEVPVAIKSFSVEEAYAAIASSASQILNNNYYTSKLYIISQTDDISAEILKDQMQFDRDIVAINSNKYSTKPLVDVKESPDFNLADAMTLGAIGASSLKTDLGLIINVLSNDPGSYLDVYFTKTFGDTTIDITPDLIRKLSFIIICICLIFFGTLYGGCYALNNVIQNNVADIASQIGNIDRTIAAESSTEVKQEVDINQIIDEIAQMNVKAIKYYDSISTDIPKNIWLTEYYNHFGDQLVIKGIAENIVDVYEYYKNLKIASPESDIKLTELKVITNAENNNNAALEGLQVDTNKSRLYSFEISNTTIGNIEQAITPPAVKEEDIIIKTNSDNNQNVEQMSNQVKPAR